MADITYSAFGQIIQRYVDMGNGADGKPSFAKQVVPVGGVAAGAADSGNPVKVGGKYNANPPALTDGNRGDLQLDSSGNLRTHLYGQLVTSSDGIGSGSVTTVSAPNAADASAAVRPLVVAGYVFNGTTWDRVTKATTTSRIPSSAATTNATAGKASSGTLYHIDCVNTSAAVKYLKVYNKATAPTVGTDVPVLTIALPPSNARTSVPFNGGMYFATGIAFAITGAAADADATAVAAGDVVGLNLVYS